MDSNNTWKSLGTVICILASSTHTLVPTFASLKILFKQKISNFPLGLGLGLVSKLNTALQEET